MSVVPTGVIFGGSGGIGRSIALHLLRNQYNIAILGRDPNKLNSTKKLLLEHHNNEENGNFSTPGNVLMVECDVTQTASIKESLQRIESNVDGSIDVLVNAAGITKDALLLRTTTEAIDELLTTNLKASLVASQAVLKGMVKRKRGSILNIGSILGIRGNTGSSIYSATKSGLIGFTKSLAKEVAPKGVSVNLIAPGFIKTDMTKSVDENQLSKFIPLQRFGEANEVAKVAMFLINSTYITGQVVVVDGGLNLNM